MAYNKNGKYTQEQITNLLYTYMVEGQSAAYVCKYILGMSVAEIGNPRFAWRKLQGYYNSYGFKKRYNNGSAFRNISKKKLEDYVLLYWNKNATENDLIAFFPEIFNDLNEAKKIEGEREIMRENSSGTESISTRNTGYSSTIFEKREPKNKAHHYTAQTSSLTRNTTNSNDTDNYYTTRESGYEINSSHAGGILAIVIFIIVIIAIGQSGIISTCFRGIANTSKNLFWILELLFFYGGIVLFIISLFKKTTRRVWTGCIGMSTLGLCFGSFSTGNFLLGIILGIIGLAFISVKTN